VLPNRDMLRVLVLALGVLLGGAVVGVLMALTSSAQNLHFPKPVELSQASAPEADYRPPASSPAPIATAFAGLPSAPMPALLPLTTPVPSRVAPNRLLIPRLGINSTWLPLGYLPNGITMDSPPGPQDLGWYSFTGQPGSSGNAVFSGHVDWHTGAPALFAHLALLTVGDEVEISRLDGSLAHYRVVSSTWYPLEGTPAAPIIAYTPTPTVTLITCGGDFDQASHEYDKRLVARAVSEG
jgi:Sortase domain